MAGTYIRWPALGGSSSGLSVGTLDGGTASPEGGSISGSTLYFQSASLTVAGLVNTLTQSFAGDKSFSGAIDASNLSGTNTGDVTLAAVGSSPSANAASLSGQILTLQPADGTHPGVLTSGTQTIGGAKTFSAAISASNLSGTNTGDVTIGTANGLSRSNQVLSLALSSTSTTGALSSTDWNTFNGKQASGNYITALTGDVTASGPGSVAATVAKIQGTTVSGTTGSTNVVFSSAPTLSNPVVGTQSQGDSSTKAASTAYVDTAIANAIAGVNPAVAVQAATTSASNTSGFTYSNGVSGIGATLTGPTNTALTVDGYTFTALGQRLLVKNDTQSPSGAFNGVYYVTQLQALGLGLVLTRALDYDMPSDINNTGAIPVINGTANGTTQWVLTSSVTAVGTDPLTFAEFTRNPADYLLKANNLSDVATPNTALNNILPSQTSNADKVLQTDGTNSSWANISNSNYVSNLGLSTAVGSNALTINLKQNDGATDPAAAGPVVVGFRNATAATGSYSLVSSTGATSIVVPSDATLGQVSAINQYVWVYALNNSGTLELAVSGVKLFDDYSIQSSTTIGAGSTSGATLYSTTGRSNVPIRLIGRLLVNESTAGTWASAVSEASLVSGKQPVTMTDWVAYTPTFTGFGTVSGVNFYYRRVGDSIEVQGTVTAGTTTATEARISLPSSLTIDSTKITDTTIVGYSLPNNAGTYTPAVLANGGLSYFTLGQRDGSNSPLTNQNANNTVSGSNKWSMFARVPISGWSTFGP